jgi:hypothetical protein
MEESLAVWLFVLGLVAPPAVMVLGALRLMVPTRQHRAARRAAHATA